MKFLIDNYYDGQNTQCLYFNSILAQLGHESRIYNAKDHSLYDILDIYKPDYYITHPNILSKDFISYSKNEKNNIKLILNTQQLQAEEIKLLDIYLKNDNVHCLLMISNLDNKNIPKLKYSKIAQILNCADENLLKLQPDIKYNIPKAYFVSSKYEAQESVPHHKITNIKELSALVDIYLPEMQLASLYSNYEEIIFPNMQNYIPQSFFDAIMLGKKVYFTSDDNNIIDLINVVLKPERSLNYNDNDRMQDFTSLKEYIKEKHYTINRVKTLLSQIPKE